MQKKKEWGVAIDEVEAKHTHNKNRVDRIHPSRNTTAHHVRTNCNLPRKDQRDCCIDGGALWVAALNFLDRNHAP